MKQNVFAKLTDSFEIKFDKNFISKYICISIFCFAVLNVLRYTAHYMTVSQSINLNW